MSTDMVRGAGDAHIDDYFGLVDDENNKIIK